MRSLIFEKKYDVTLKNFSTIEEINRCVEKKEGRKLDYKRSDNIIMAKGGSVFKINTTNPSKVIDTVLSKKNLFK
jgi:hypothetical protein